MNVIFLDYDGVVNTPIVNGMECSMLYPSDKRVNNSYAVSLISKLCLEHNCCIEVISTWRDSPFYRESLYNSGLNRNIIVSCCNDILKTKTECIYAYLERHPEIEDYIIIDDMMIDDINETRFVKCDFETGFGAEEYSKSKSIFDSGGTL